MDGRWKGIEVAHQTPGAIGPTMEVGRGGPAPTSQPIVIPYNNNPMNPMGMAQVAGQAAQMEFTEPASQMFFNHNRYNANSGMYDSALSEWEQQYGKIQSLDIQNRLDRLDRSKGKSSDMTKDQIRQMNQQRFGSA